MTIEANLAKLSELGNKTKLSYYEGQLPKLSDHPSF